MKTLFKLFRRQSTPPPSISPVSTRDDPLTIEDGSDNATRKQLVQVLLRDVLRKSGIPPAWIECRMLVVVSRTKGSGMFVRLVIKHWDARLMDYAFAFQNTLLTDIERFDQNVDWLHGISWELELGDSCPYKTLPEKSFWENPVAKDAALAPAAFVSVMAPELTAAATSAPSFESRNDDDDPEKDLEALFAIRDKELEKQGVEGLNPVGYEKTQPSPL